MLAKLRTHAPMVVALIALFFAIGGPSFASDAAKSAAKLITGKQVKDSSLTTKDIKNGSLLKVDFKAGQLPAGAQGPKGDTGAQGPKGNTGATGDPGTARGYAHVNSDGTLDLAHSKNVDRAVKFSTGAYCVNFTFNPDNVIATLDFGAVGQVNAGPSFCSGAAGTYNAQVRTYDSAGTLAGQDHVFFIMGN